MITAILLGIVAPLLHVLVARIPTDQVSAWVRRVAPTILWPAAHDPTIETASDDKVALVGSRRLFDPEEVMTDLVLNLLMLVTFGFSSPLLALALGFYAFTTTLMWQLLLGRFLLAGTARLGLEALDQGVVTSKHAHRLEQTCAQQSGRVHHRMMRACVCFWYIFMACILYDMAVVDSWAEASWLPAGLACIPGGVWLYSLFRRPTAHNLSIDRAKSAISTGPTDYY